MSYCYIVRASPTRLKKTNPYHHVVDDHGIYTSHLNGIGSNNKLNRSTNLGYVAKI